MSSLIFYFSLENINCRNVANTFHQLFFADLNSDKKEKTTDV